MKKRLFIVLSDKMNELEREVAINVDNITDMHEVDPPKIPSSSNVDRTRIFFGAEDSAIVINMSLKDVLLKIKEAELEQTIDSVLSERVA
jgi:hypothetical protein